MGATGWLVRRQLRRRWAALVLLALVVAAGATAALVTIGAADRTASAYDRYLRRADVSDVQVNPSLRTRQIDEAVRGLPGVRSVTSDVILYAGIDPEGVPRTAAELSSSPDPALQVRGSTDGRYVVMDRPELSAGRLPTGHDEAFVTEELVADKGIRLGDVLPLSFWGRVPGTDLHPDFVDDEQADTVELPPLGVEHLTVVGIGTLPDEVLPEGLYPRSRIIVSPDVTARYDCLPDAPAIDATFEEALDVLLVEGCAAQYGFYSLVIESGDDGVAAAMDAFLARARELDDQLSRDLRDQAGAGYFLIPTTTAHERQRVERSIQPTVAVLWALGGLTAAVTVVVTGLAVARELRRSDDDLARWWQLGLTTAERARVVGLPLLVALGAGLALAVGAAWALSPIGPVGSVRSVDPSPSRSLSGSVGLGFLALAALTTVTTVALAHRAARQAGHRGARPADDRRADDRQASSALQRFVRRSRRPEVVEGVRAAQTGYRGTALVMVSGGVAAAVFLAAVVFGASLANVVSTPAAYGWPWDVAAMVNFGYGPADLDRVRRDVGARDDVVSWTAFAFTSDVTVDGEPVVSVVGLDRTSTVDLPLAAGRLPGAADEVALGARTAADLGVGVGDRVEVAGGGIPGRSAAVSGLVVLPPLGPFVADRASPGTGMLVPEAMAPEELLTQSVAFVGIDLADGAEAHDVATEMRDDFAGWDPRGWTVLDYDRPVRPAEIVDADRMRTVPLLAGTLLVVAAVVGLALAVVLSVRSRRRELAILRALGFTGRQLRTSVRVQAVVTTAVALVVGIPAGIVVGRLAWRAFADELGVAAGPVIPLRWVAATLVGGLVVALVAAALPARIAARIDPAAVLRSE